MATGAQLKLPQSSPAVVTLNSVDVVIAGHTVLHKVNWELHQGEHWAIVGANGSGKTSFLKLVSGTLWPAPGRGVRCYNFGSGLQTDAVEALGRITLVGHELQDHYIRLGWNFSAVEVVLSGIFCTNIPRRRANEKENRSWSMNRAARARSSRTTRTPTPPLASSFRISITWIW